MSWVMCVNTVRWAAMRAAASRLSASVKCVGCARSRSMSRTSVSSPRRSGQVSGGIALTSVQ